MGILVGERSRWRKKRFQGQGVSEISLLRKKHPLLPIFYETKQGRSLQDKKLLFFYVNNKIYCLWSFIMTMHWSAWLSDDWSIYCPYHEKRKGFGAPSLQDCSPKPWSITMFIVTDYTRVGQHIFIWGQWFFMSWLLFRPQCHLVSDKVGNFHGNKALVTFL